MLSLLVSFGKDFEVSDASVYLRNCGQFFHILMHIESRPDDSDKLYSDQSLEDDFIGDLGIVFQDCYKEIKTK